MDHATNDPSSSLHSSSPASSTMKRSGRIGSISTDEANSTSKANNGAVKMMGLNMDDDDEEDGDWCITAFEGTSGNPQEIGYGYGSKQTRKEHGGDNQDGEDGRKLSPTSVADFTTPKRSNLTPQLQNTPEITSLAGPNVKNSNVSPLQQKTSPGMRRIASLNKLAQKRQELKAALAAKRSRNSPEKSVPSPAAAAAAVGDTSSTTPGTKSKGGMRRIASLSVLAQKRQELIAATAKKLKRSSSKSKKKKKIRQTSFSGFSASHRSKGIDETEEEKFFSQSLVYDVSRSESLLSLDSTSSTTTNSKYSVRSSASSVTSQTSYDRYDPMNRSSSERRQDSSRLVLENIDLLTSQDPLSIIGKLDNFGRGVGIKRSYSGKAGTPTAAAAAAMGGAATTDDTSQISHDSASSYRSGIVLVGSADDGASEAGYSTQTIDYDDDVSDFGHDGHVLRPLVVMAMPEDGSMSVSASSSSLPSNATTATNASKSQNLPDEDAADASSVPSLHTENSIKTTSQVASTRSSFSVSNNPEFSNIVDELDGILGELNVLVGDTDDEGTADDSVGVAAVFRGLKVDEEDENDEQRAESATGKGAHEEDENIEEEIIDFAETSIPAPSLPRSKPLITESKTKSTIAIGDDENSTELISQDETDVIGTEVVPPNDDEVDRPRNDSLQQDSVGAHKDDNAEDEDDDDDGKVEKGNNNDATESSLRDNSVNEGEKEQGDDLATIPATLRTDNIENESVEIVLCENDGNYSFLPKLSEAEDHVSESNAEIDMVTASSSLLQEHKDTSKDEDAGDHNSGDEKAEVISSSIDGVEQIIDRQIEQGDNSNNNNIEPLLLQEGDKIGDNDPASVTLKADNAEVTYAETMIQRNVTSSTPKSAVTRSAPVEEFIPQPRIDQNNEVVEVQENSIEMTEFAADKTRAAIVMLVYASLIWYSFSSSTTAADSKSTDVVEIDNPHEVIDSAFIDNGDHSLSTEPESLENMTQEKWVIGKNICSIIYVASVCYLSTVHSRREPDTPTQERVQRQQMKEIIQMTLKNRKVSLLVSYVVIGSYLLDGLFFILSISFR